MAESEVHVLDFQTGDSKRDIFFKNSTLFSGSGIFIYFCSDGRKCCFQVWRVVSGCFSARFFLEILKIFDF